MDSKQYVKNAIRTESVIETAVANDAEVFNQVIQAFIASATLLDMYKKNIYYGKPINQQKWTENAIVLHDAGYDLEQINMDVLSEQSPGDPLTIDTRVLHASIGIATEAGEIMEAVLKGLIAQEPLDGVNLQEEIGDLNWYEALMVDALGADWDQIRERNIAKLRKRYPEKFTSENAINRDLEGERKILEGGSNVCWLCEGKGTRLVHHVGDDHGHYGWSEEERCTNCDGRGYHE